MAVIGFATVHCWEYVRVKCNSRRRSRKEVVRAVLTTAKAAARRRHGTVAVVS